MFSRYVIIIIINSWYVIIIIIIIIIINSHLLLSVPQDFPTVRPSVFLFSAFLFYDSWFIDNQLAKCFTNHLTT